MVLKVSQRERFTFETNKNQFIGKVTVAIFDQQIMALDQLNQKPLSTCPRVNRGSQLVRVNEKVSD